MSAAWQNILMFVPHIKGNGRIKLISESGIPIRKHKSTSKHLPYLDVDIFAHLRTKSAVARRKYAALLCVMQVLTTQ